MLAAIAVLFVQPDIAPEASEGLRVINYYRRMAGLPDARLNPLIGKASQNHAEYCARNSFSHREIAGKPGFTGVTPRERLEAVGFRGSMVGECMAMGQTFAYEAYADLVAVPYHRLPFIQGDRLEIGFGAAKSQRVWVSNFSGNVSQMIVWPPDGSRLVPPQGNVRESPDPMRVHGGKDYDVGYVISATIAEDNVRLIKAELKDADGAVVPAYVNHSGNDDHCDNAVLIIPTQRLKPNKTYVASIALRTRAGQLQKTWQFSTGTPTENFDYASRYRAYPRAQAGGKKFHATFDSISADGRSLTVSSLAETGVSSRPQAGTRAFKIVPSTLLRSGVDPLGVSSPRVLPKKGARVIFSTLPKDSGAISELMISRDQPR